MPSFICVIVVVGVCGLSSAAAQDSSARVDAGQVHLGAKMNVSGNSGVDTEWLASVIRQMKPSLKGRIKVAGPNNSAISSAEVVWSVDGANVTGTVIDSEGIVLASFEGTATSPTSIAGKFSTPDGVVGPWSWEGEPVAE